MPDQSNRAAWMGCMPLVVLLMALTWPDPLEAREGVANGTRGLVAADGNRPLSVAAHDVAPGLASDPTLTLSQVIRMAGDRDPGRIGVEAREVEREALHAASRRWLAGAPSVFGIVVDDGVDNDDGYRQWDTGLELPLWVPGQVAPRRRAAEAAGEAAVEATAAHALEVARHVRAALGSIVMGEARLQRTRLDHDAELALARRLEQAAALGEVAERVLLVAQAEVLERELACFEAREELERAYATWSLITGLERRPAHWQESLAMGGRLEDHPLLRLARTEVEQAEAALQQIERANWGNPSLTLGSQHERTARGVDWDHRLVAGMQIPIGRVDPLASGEIAARQAVSQARQSAALIERELRAQQLRSERRLELAGLRVANTARHRALATDHLDLVERGFALGELDLPDLIEARTRARNALWAEREAAILYDILIGESNQALGVVP